MKSKTDFECENVLISIEFWQKRCREPVVKHRVGNSRGGDNPS